MLFILHFYAFIIVVFCRSALQPLGQVFVNENWFSLDLPGKIKMFIITINTVSTIFYKLKYGYSFLKNSLC